MWRKARMWKLQDLTTESTWGAIERVESSWTPRILTEVSYFMSQPVKCSTLFSRCFASCCRVPNRMASVLSAFSCRSLMRNQPVTTWTQSTSAWRFVTSSDLTVVYSWVSSAYWWNLMPWLLKIWAKRLEPHTARKTTDRVRFPGEFRTCIDSNWIIQSVWKKETGFTIHRIWFLKFPGRVSKQPKLIQFYTYSILRLLA